MNMAPINYDSTKKKRQTPKSLALKGEAPPVLTSNIVAECPPTVKRGRGRPRLPEGTARKFVLPIRLSKVEYDRIKEAAEAVGKDVFVWMRDQLLIAASIEIYEAKLGARKPGADE